MFLRTSAAGWAAFLLRFSLGLLMFVAGLNKFLQPGGPAAIMDWMSNEFAKTWLPLVLVRPFAFALPFLEVALGLFLATGLYRVPALAVNGLLLLALLFGQLVMGTSETAPLMFLYLGATAGALLLSASDTLTLENLLDR